MEKGESPSKEVEDMAEMRENSKIQQRGYTMNTLDEVIEKYIDTVNEVISTPDFRMGNLTTEDMLSMYEEYTKGSRISLPQNVSAEIREPFYVLNERIHSAEIKLSPTQAQYGRLRGSLPYCWCRLFLFALGLKEAKTKPPRNR